jgi:hypothetical protein
MSALRQLSAHYTADRPSESYAAIGRRGSSTHRSPSGNVLSDARDDEVERLSRQIAVK